MKPCPFCGGNDISWGKSALGIRFKCMTCHAEGPPVLKEIRGRSAWETTHLRAKEAESLWNGRAALREEKGE